MGGEKIQRFKTRVRLSGDLPTVEVEVQLDLPYLIQQVAERALYNKSRHARAMCGAVVVNVTSDQMNPREIDAAVTKALAGRKSQSSPSE